MSQTAPSCYAKGYSPTNGNCVQNCGWVNGCAISRGFVPPNPQQPAPMMQGAVPPPPQFIQPTFTTAGPSGVPVPPVNMMAGQMQQAQGQGNIMRANFIPMPTPRITRPREGEPALSRFGKNVFMSSMEMLVATGYLWLQQIEL